MPNTKTVLVTGGTGYIGSHVAKKFKQEGWEVIVVDRERREHTLKYVDEFHQCDYDSDESYDLLFHGKVDAIVHCAGTSLVGPSVTAPGVYYSNNVGKSIRYFNTVAGLEFKPVVIFSSSAAVYGEPEFLPIPETSLKNPTNPYGRTKLMIEQILEDYDRAYGLKSACLRYFNACGADPDGELGQEPGATHIIARLLEAKINNQVFTLNGNNFDTVDGTCVRDYVHVTDLADAHYLAVQKVNEVGSFTANLGTRSGYSNQYIIDAAKAIVGHIDVKNGPSREGDPSELVADPSYAKVVLNWEPKRSDLNTIITTAWNWYNQKG